jgi:hypothetical protein
MGIAPSKRLNVTMPEPKRPAEGVAVHRSRLGRLTAAKSAAERVLELQPGFTTSGLCASFDIHPSLAAPLSEALIVAGLPTQRRRGKGLDQDSIVSASAPSLRKADRPLSASFGRSAVIAGRLDKDPEAEVDGQPPESGASPALLPMCSLMIPYGK